MAFEIIESYTVTLAKGGSRAEDSVYHFKQAQANFSDLPPSDLDVNVSRIVVPISQSNNIVSAINAAKACEEASFHASEPDRTWLASVSNSIRSINFKSPPKGSHYLIRLSR